MFDNMHIAIDGPAGSGKSTIAKQLAKRLDMLYIDTGAMYRALTYKVINSDIATEDYSSVIGLAMTTEITFKNTKVYLDGRDVTREIRCQSVDKRVSEVARIPGVREQMVKIQRQMAKSRNVVMDGRDIGTVVLPQAKFKFYLTAGIEERAERRYKDIVKNNPHISLAQVKADIERRDLLDSEREYAPLRAAADARTIDTSGKSIEAVLQEMIGLIGGKGDAV